MGSARNVGRLLFNEFEVLDFAGSFEVFPLAENDINGDHPKLCVTAYNPLTGE